MQLHILHFNNSSMEWNYIKVYINRIQRIYVWHCGKCFAKTFKNMDGNSKCQPCKYHYITNELQMKCLDPFKDAYLSLDDNVVIPIYCVWKLVVPSSMYRRQSPVVRVCVSDPVRTIMAPSRMIR